MKKTLILVFTLTIVMGLYSCNQNKKVEVTTQEAENFSGFDEEHNAELSLDIAGVYEGILPCADCEGIRTELVLNENGNYLMKMTYLGRNTTFEENGKWEVKKNTLTLFDAQSETSSIKYFVGENFIKQLDQEGNEITGDLAENFILNKKI